MRLGFQFVVATALVVLAIGLGGCGGGGGANLPDPIIRFVNSSPDSNPLDFYRDDPNVPSNKLATALAYLSSSADITISKFDTVNGNALFVVDPPNQLDAVTFTFARDTKYLGLTVGLENFGTENAKRLQLLAFQYDKNAPNGTKARLLIIHGYMRAVGFDTPNIDFQNPGNNPQFSSLNIAFANNPPAVLEIDANNQHFQARRAGTENVIADDGGTTTFASGGIYLALVSGVENGTGTQAPQIKYIKLN